MGYMKMSAQAMAVLMALLQKCLAEQSDIVPMLEELNFDVEEGHLFVTNPPTSFVTGGDESEEV